MARGNVARDVLIPDMTGFSDWNFTAGTDDLLGQRLRDGYDIGAAAAVSDPSRMTEFDRVALERMRGMHDLIELTMTWFDDVQRMDSQTLAKLMRMGAKVQRLLEVTDKVRAAAGGRK